MGDQQPIPYWDAHEPPPAQGVPGESWFGIASVACFALFFLILTAGFAWLLFVEDHTMQWSGLRPLFAMACAAVVLVPLGLLCGAIGLTAPPERRSAAVLGLTLNGLVLVAGLLMRFG